MTTPIDPEPQEQPVTDDPDELTMLRTEVERLKESLRVHKNELFKQSYSPPAMTLEDAVAVVNEAIAVGAIERRWSTWQTLSWEKVESGWSFRVRPQPITKTVTIPPEHAADLAAWVAEHGGSVT